MKHKIVGDISCMKCDMRLEYDLTLENVNTIDLYDRTQDVLIWCEFCEEPTTIRLADIRASDDCTCSVCSFWRVRDLSYEFSASACYLGTVWYILHTSN